MLETNFQFWSSYKTLCMLLLDKEESIPLLFYKVLSIIELIISFNGSTKLCYENFGNV